MQFHSKVKKTLSWLAIRSTCTSWSAWSVSEHSKQCWIHPKLAVLHGGSVLMESVYPAEVDEWCTSHIHLQQVQQTLQHVKYIRQMAAQHEEPADGCVNYGVPPTMAEATSPHSSNTHGFIMELPLSDILLGLLGSVLDRLDPPPIQNSRAPKSATFCTGTQ